MVLGSGGIGPAASSPAYVKDRFERSIGKTQPTMSPRPAFVNVRAVRGEAIARSGEVFPDLGWPPPP
jgi:hypothetical protein